MEYLWKWKIFMKMLNYKENRKYFCKCKYINDISYIMENIP